MRNGSSPLARGTRLLSSISDRRPRFIPARTGNTSASRGSDAPLSVHPRSHGEHLSEYRANRVTIGSSPLARGTLHRAATKSARGRFIPARTGNTFAHVLQSRCPTGSSPLARGTRSELAASEYIDYGSSPLARGTRRRLGTRYCGARFIPARTGNTSPTARLAVSGAVHPRSHGEHSGSRREGR